MRRLGCLALLLPALAFGVACLPAAQALRAPVLDQDHAASLLMAADSARAAAFATADPAPLRPLFADSAIGPLLPQLGDLHRHRARIVEQDSTRRLVHWSPGEDGGAGVLEAIGQERVEVTGYSPLAWSRIVRQWFAAIRWSGGRWLVVEARDLPPAQWWKS